MLGLCDHEYEPTEKFDITQVTHRKLSLNEIWYCTDHDLDPGKYSEVKQQFIVYVLKCKKCHAIKENKVTF